MITRYNYEEYFLMYVDNELSTAERNAVEGFIQQNPDLANELTMIQGSVIKPESNIVFNNKASLLKNVETNSIINLNNYEEYFLLYLDNELDAKTKKQVEEFVSRNPSLQNEWNILQQTKLEPETAIVFEGKEILYKEEEKRRIPFAWIMSAAAVAILLVTGFLLLNRKNTEVKIQPTDIAKNNTDQKNKSTENIKEPVAVTSVKVDTLNNSSLVKEETTRQSLKGKNQPSKNIVAVQNKKEGKKEPEMLTTINTSENPDKANELAIAETVKPASVIVSTSTPDVNIAPNKLVVVVDQPDEKFNTDKNKSSYTKLTSTVIEDPYAPNDDSEKKNKLRGIFRRVSRVFNKNDADNDSSKRSVSIGIFQIALK